MNAAKLFNSYCLGFRPGMIFCNNSHQFVREKILNTELFVADPTGRDRDINGTLLQFEQWSSRRLGYQFQFHIRAFSFELACYSAEPWICGVALSGKS